ncbi:prephenate dehydratase [Candidatus Daviesbacteria bacterium]|nr:prephenate dehydratase [Candidatus Daviesbacteria bacterium]
MDNLRIHIIGGTGAMGNWLKNFLESQGVSSTISGKNNSKSDDVKNSDIIFISVPISIAPKVIDETSKISRDDVLLVDLSSIISKTSKSLEKTKNGALCMHLLFGPKLSSIENQKVIFVEIKKHKLIENLRKLIQNAGGQIINLGLKEHDFQMAHIQALIHFINISLAKTLLQNKINTAGKISTPVFLNQVSVLSRVLAQDEELISQLQINNPEYPAILKNHLKNQEVLIKLIIKKKEDLIKKEIRTLKSQVEPNPTKIQTIIDKHKSLKLNLKKVKLGFLGPNGTFSHQAALKVVDSNEQTLIPKPTLFDIFQALSYGELDFGVVPAENSTEGTIRETLDFLVKFNLKTNGSLELKVNQNLLSKESSLNKIKKVISHPQGIAQCKHYLNENLPQVQLEYSASTLSGIANDAAKKGVAFIGPSLAAKLYNLNILAKNIEDNQNNITKFYLISKHLNPLAKVSTKTLLFLTIFNRVGILRDILSVFADLGINLNKIESRPSKEKVWDYYFFIEVEVNLNDQKLTQALNILKQYCPVTKILGAV